MTAKGLMAAAIVLTITATSAARAEAVVRPRMLLAQTDPFSGIPALKARYAAGARPSDDALGWALTYVLTGDESFASVDGRTVAGDVSNQPAGLRGTDQSFMGGDRGVLGRQILLNGEPFSVIGILPGASEFDRRANDIWIPLAFPPQVPRNYHSYSAVARLKRIARTMPRRSPLTKVTSALCIATSAPVPIAIPTSACASAGASLTPSPAMATLRPWV